MNYWKTGWFCVRCHKRLVPARKPYYSTCQHCGKNHDGNTLLGSYKCVRDKWWHLGYELWQCNTIWGDKIVSSRDVEASEQ